MLLLYFLCLISTAQAFYLPGVAPTTYHANDDIQLLVNHITPSNIHSANGNDKNTKTFVYSFDYYFPKLHFCKPKNGEPQAQSESLGSIIFGDRIYNSPFEIKMLEDKSCVKLCTSTYSQSDALFFNKLIRSGYYHNWIIDGLPAAKLVRDQKTHSDFYGSGFPIGLIDEQNMAYMANHFDIRIEYHQRKEDEFRIVGVSVEPYSLSRKVPDNEDGNSEYCENVDKYSPLLFDNGQDTEVDFTYSVTFEASDTVWATRWDKYLHVYDPKIQWFSLINFSLIVLCLSMVIGHILVKTLRNDIYKYNTIDLDDEIQEESGWKLVHTDIFRAPKRRMLLSVVTGSGAQLFLMTFTTILFALLGLLSPSNRGALSTVMFILYALFGFVGSFVSGFLYKFFDGDNWKLNMVLTPLLVPGALFLSFVGLNFFLIFAGSSGAIPIGTMFSIVVIWFVISIPLSVLGSLFSVKFNRGLSKPVKTNQIPRQIPGQPFYLKLPVISAFAGIFPFGSMAVEIYFIYSSIWFNRIYYMFGFLFFCFLLMTITCALITVLMTYYTLCFENYRWQWRSFIVSGSCAAYIFIHSLFLIKLDRLNGFNSVVLYLGYSAMVSGLVFILCGSIGFICSLFFVKKIYSEIKVD
ncbi:Emp70 protein [Saccharomycopsis crataegensis]|uniref:Transmembrane 9 superfamily member n=1 Tax=Saccharomycopsis crataegensis TaxID=43959 RepID=A0AAV5QUQ5_9ASCO|nr:Emp70 protein [Saccharomycopsis crataegensis]